MTAAPLTACLTRCLLPNTQTAGSPLSVCQDRPRVAPAAPCKWQAVLVPYLSVRYVRMPALACSEHQEYPNCSPVPSNIREWHRHTETDRKADFPAESEPRQILHPGRLPS